MSKEKFIRGKKDDANHAGLYHNRKQEQAADAHLEAYLRGDFDDIDGPLAQEVEHLSLKQVVLGSIPRWFTVMGL